MYVKFGDIPALSGLLGLLKVWRTPLAKHPIYLVLLRCLAVSMYYNIQTTSRWGLKSMGIIPMHLRKMPLKYWGMVPSWSGPLRYRTADTMVKGVPSEMVGIKLYVGIKYILCVN